MANHTQAAPKWLNPQYFEKMLREYFEENSLRIEDFVISPGSNAGDNYACQIFRITVQTSIKDRKKSLIIIGKLLPDTETSKEINKNFDLFKTEKTMITETLPLMYKKLHERGHSDRFFPFLYKLDAENKMIFMEDLKPQGFQMVDKQPGLDLDHSLLVIKSLAKLHASGYLLLKENPSYKNKYLDYFFKKEKDHFLDRFLEGALSYVVSSLDDWPISEEDKNIFRSFKGKLYDLMCDTYDRNGSSFNVILHGDCWVNNMMFKFENGKVTDVKLIDYQLSNYNSFILDLHYFLFTSAKVEVIIENLEEILKTYYETFISVTGEIEGFNMDRIWKEFRERIGFGFPIGICFRASMLAPKPFNLDALMEGTEPPENIECFKSKKFVSDMIKLLPLFKKYGIFK